MRECPICGKIIKSGEKACSECMSELDEKSPEASNGMSDNELDDVNEFDQTDLPDESDIELNVNEISDSKDDNQNKDQAEDTSENNIEIENNLIAVDNTPFDDYMERAVDNVDSDEDVLRRSDISDQIIPAQRVTDDSNQFEQTAKKTNDNQEVAAAAHSEANLEPDAMVSESDRSNLINSLHSKIPDIIHRKQENTAVMTREHEPQTIIRPDKIETEANPEQEKSIKNGSEPRTEIFQMPANPSMSKTESGQIIFLKGSKLLLPAGVTINEGAMITLAGKNYPVKKKKKDRKTWILTGLLGIIGLFIIITMISRLFAPGNSGKLVGLVLNAETRAVIPDAQIFINELNQTVYSDKNGLFEISNILEKELSLSASKPQYSTASLGFSLPPDETEVLTVYMEPSSPSLANRDELTKSVQTKKAKVKKQKSFGKLMVTTEVNNARIIVDNKVLGPSNKVYSKLFSGKHKLVVTKEGYKEYSGIVNISSNKTTSINVDLDKIETKYDPSEIGYDQYVEMGDNLVSESKWQEAAGQYTMALAKKDEAVTYRKRAEVYLNMNQNRQAAADLFSAATYYTLEGTITEAVKCYNDVIKIYPENSEAYRERGFALLKTGDYNGSLDDLKHAVKLDNKSFENQKKLGEALYIMGNYKESIKSLKNARKLDDSNAHVYALLALSSMARGKDKDARRFYKGFEMRANESDKKEFNRDPDWQRLAHIVSQKD